MFIAILLSIGFVVGLYAEKLRLKIFAFFKREKPISIENARKLTPKEVDRVNHLFKWCNEKISANENSRFTAHFVSESDSKKIINYLIKSYEDSGWKVARNAKNNTLVTFSVPEKPKPQKTEEEKLKQEVEESIKEIDKMLNSDKELN